VKGELAGVKRDL